MKPIRLLWWAILWCAWASPIPGACQEPSSVPLPPGVRAVWDTSRAYRETTPTRERICINGLWRWQPVEEVAARPPRGGWGYFKAPGAWPGITDYLQKDCQAVYRHPAWKGIRFESVAAAWYQREIAIPRPWAGRRIALAADYVNSYAAVYVDGQKAGEIRFPAGEADLTPFCRPGARHLLSLLVIAAPLQAVTRSFDDTSLPREARGSVARRGLCGDLFLTGAPARERIADIRVDTSVKGWRIALSAEPDGLARNGRYRLRARITDRGRLVREFAGRPFGAGDLKDGRIALVANWRPEKLWDIHTPGNRYDLRLSLADSRGKILDTAHPVRFGFREFRIRGRDFYLNGSRIYLCAVPLDNAQIGAAWASYDSARESLLRLKAIGVNFVYTHNYDCEPGAHLSFAEILKAADDTGMLVALSQPHFGQYDWQPPDAARKNGYAGHARFYVRAAGSHPSVVAYAMSHNATGYVEAMNPDKIDGLQDPRDSWSQRNARSALQAESIVRRMDPTRIVYHHSSGNLGAMHTNNFYPNFAPIQEMSDWFEYWSLRGVKPLFLCEFAAPYTWDFSMYRGWYQGQRTFGSAVVPWELCLAEWNAQFFGDGAFRIGEVEKTCLRWEARQFREGKLWHRWDYPHQMGSRDFDEQYPVLALYLTDNWRAFRTWGVSAINPWEYSVFWKPRIGAERSRKNLKVDWERLQRPGFSADYIEERYERIDTAFQLSDWIPTPAGKSLLRNNGPLLGYIAGKPAAFTGKDHIFTPGETVAKQLIVINNSRQTVTARCRWAFGLPRPQAGSRDIRVQTGEQARIPLAFPLPAGLASGRYRLSASVRFGNGETQRDSMTVHVMIPAKPVRPEAKVALFDPAGKTGGLLRRLDVRFQTVSVDADLSGFDMLVVGQQALAADGPGPDLSRVTEGLKVVVFEQTAEALEKRLGFRATEYGLRQVFKRIPDHPLLAGLDTEHLRDWRGAATVLPPRLAYEINDSYQHTTPTVKWCGIDVPRVWRCGNRGNVSSVLIEKPARGDFLPVLDGGYSLQYSPLLLYREGKGMVLFCQMDVTGRTEPEPAADILARNILKYTAAWRPPPVRKVIYAGDPAGKRHLEAAGITPGRYAGGSLPEDAVLVAGPGSDRELSGSAPAMAPWLKSGGYLLAVGLNEREAAGILPFPVGMKEAEHIASFFEAMPAASLLAGVGPADVHNRDPRAIPLMASGARVIGSGVLAQEGNAVFCQLPPWQWERPKQANLRRTYRRTAFLLNRLLANMGASGSTPLLSRFRTPPKAPGDEKRWLEGLYLDRPEAWDDPYRFFCW
ncbi:MAG: hypothetical protein IT210_22825 [Armatimonadetes bacterium]|nr:hypothetical protein [Armatimonadota bacterium]